MPGPSSGLCTQVLRALNQPSGGTGARANAIRIVRRASEGGGGSGETCLAIEQEAGGPAGNKNADAKGGASGAGRGDGHEVAFEGP